MSVLDMLFSSRLGALTMDFLRLLTDKNREDALREISEEFMRRLDERLGIVNMEVLAPLELPKDQREALQRQFEEMTRKKVRLSVSMDEQLLGGLVAKVGDTVFDGSLRRQLELLRERFAENVGST